MLVKYEKRIYSGNEKIWVGAYVNLHNLSHWHIDNEIIYVHSGDATVSIDGELYYLKQTDSVFCQSGSVHYIKGSENSMIYIFLFDNSLINHITDQYALKNPILKHEYHLAENFETLKNILKNRHRFYEFKMNTIITSLMSEIFMQEAVMMKTTKIKTISNYKRLLNMIDQQFDHITFQDAANFMAFSKAYFSKWFKNICGMTFSRYLNIVKIEKAIGLINNGEDMSITEIASKCGYASIRHFNRMFLLETSYSPKQLPANFRLNIKPIKTVKDAFDPTLEQSRLVW